MYKEFKLNLKGLDCANCANKIEERVNKLEEVEEANMNFSLGRINIKIKNEDYKQNVINHVITIVKELEPDVEVSEYKKVSKPLKKPNSNNHTNTNKDNEIKLILEGLNCANCANKIEARVNNLENVIEASLNFSVSKLLIKFNENIEKATIIDSVKKIVKELEPDVVVKEDGKEKQIKDIKNHEHQHCDGECCRHDEGQVLDTENEQGYEPGFLKKNWSLLLGIVLYATALIFKDKEYINLILFLVAYILVGGKVVMTALRNITRGQVFDENFLMTIATLGAFIIGEYPEAVAVMIFYEVGELFQSYAVNRSRKSITSLMDLRSDYANLLTESGEKTVDPEDVNIDDVIIVKPGERVPLDGILIDGICSLDTSALTGESIPRDVQIDDEILSGTINLNSVIKVKVTKVFGESTISRILEMVENAGNKKAHTEKFITKFCKYYTPIVVFSAVAIAIIPPFVIKDANFSTWIYRALSFLVVSCPCALVVSVPLGLFSGIGGASRKGILVKGGNYLEALKDVDIVVLDKTGTLTKGSFKVTEVNVYNISKDRLIEIAALGESFSNHPIAQSIVKEYNKEIDKSRIKNYTELSGHGIKAEIDEEEVLLGNFKLMKKYNIECKETQSVGTVVYVAISEKCVGSIVIEDAIKEDSKEAVKRLKNLGIRKVVMLTGDNKKVAEKVGNELEIDEIYGELLPGDKVGKVEELLNNNSNNKLVFVGDGINDAPVLARADIGVAMGGIGSDAAIEAADVVLMKDSINSLADAIVIGRKTNKILWQNIIFSLVIKVGVLILISFGMSSMWEAVFADVGVTLIAVLNSMRALKL